MHAYKVTTKPSRDARTAQTFTVRAASPEEARATIGRPAYIVSVEHDKLCHAFSGTSCEKA